MSLYSKIEIPLTSHGHGDEVIELDHLPEPSEALGILQQEDCKINLWIQLAVEYYRQGKHDAFELLLNTCLSRWDQEKIKSNLANYPDGDKDRIRALDLLAIFYVRQANKTKSRDKRRDFAARATQRFTEVDKSESISKHGAEYQFHLLGRAYHCLIEGRNDQADAQFNFVLQQQQQSGEPENVPSLLGRACIEFNKKEGSGKRTALSLYKKALQVCPNCPADVRLGMAICFYKLNMLDKAEEAFAKALSLDPKCVGALTGLAVIELNRKTNTSIKQGMEYLSKAYKIDSTDPMVLTLLADHFFYANEHDKVIKLATKAMENTDNEAMQAQACYQLARAYHKKKDYDNAFEYYYKATQFGGSQFFLAFYGLGQMYIHRGENDPAIQAFETVLKTNPDNHETLKILASLYAMSNNSNKKEQARNYLKKVTEKKPDDVEAWVELASLTEQNNTPVALNAYRTAIKLYETRSQTIPPELYNNIAALLFSIEALDESEKYYKLALERCQEEMPNNELHYGSIIYTIRYNMGRLYEAKHETNEAEETYKTILIQHPMYLDCYLRLGCMERAKGLLFDASDKYKETFRIEPDNFEAWTLLGNLHFSKLELKPCQSKFERILERTKSQPDIYSLITVGNVWLQSLYQPSRDKAKQHSRALSFFKHALKHDPKNIYAASGIGCLLAINEMFNEARDVFSQVREATADFPDVWINIAHIYVEQKQYVAAVQMYENCLKKFFNNSNTEIFSYIARALFKANKLAECKKVLLKARYLCPYDLMILFNLAKVLKSLAKQTFEDRKSTYHAVVTAEYELKLAQTYFHHYVELKDKTKSEYDKSSIDLITIAQREERDCADLLLQVEKTVKSDAEQRDKEETRRRQEQEEQLAKELARKAEEEERRQQEERQRREELENKRKELLRRQEETKQKLLQEDAGIIADDGSEDGEHRGKRKKKSSKEGKKKEKRDKDSSMKEKEPEQHERENKKYKSRAILSSDSDSSDNDQ